MLNGVDSHLLTYSRHVVYILQFSGLEKTDVKDVENILQECAQQWIRLNSPSSLELLKTVLYLLFLKISFAGIHLVCFFL